jgi:hypothetical protein
VCETETEAEAPPLIVVFGVDAEGPIAVAEVDRGDWPKVFVARGAVAEFCADNTFWKLLAEGPVVCVFENHIEGHAIIEAYAEVRRRRLH